MSSQIKKYSALVLLFGFLFPRVVSDLHYIHDHHFNKKQKKGTVCLISYKYEHVCENHLLKLHIFSIFDFPFFEVILFPKFEVFICNKIKRDIIKRFFDVKNKRGPPGILDDGE